MEWQKQRRTEPWKVFKQQVRHKLALWSLRQAGAHLLLHAPLRTKAVTQAQCKRCSGKPPTVYSQDLTTNPWSKLYHQFTPSPQSVQWLSDFKKKRLFQLTTSKYSQSTYYWKQQTSLLGTSSQHTCKAIMGRPRSNQISHFMGCGFEWVPETSSLLQRSETHKKFPTQLNLSSTLQGFHNFILAQFAFVCYSVKIGLIWIGHRQPHL